MEDIYQNSHTPMSGESVSSQEATIELPSSIQIETKEIDRELEELLKNIGFKIVSIEEDNKNIIAVVKKPKSIFS